MTSDNAFSEAFDPLEFSAGLPASRTFVPKWLAPADVKEWLKLHEQDTDDDDLIVRVSAQTEPYVERCRPEWLVVDEAGVGSYSPDAETYQGAVMYAARQFARRNSPQGIQMFGDAPSFVARYDPDIDKALRTGSFMSPVLG